MPTIADTLTMLAKKASVDITDLSKLFAEHEPLRTLEVPDVTYNLLEKGLLTIDQAKHNSDLKSYYTRQALDTVDAKIGEVIGEYEIDSPEITATSSSYEKIKILAGAIRKKEAEKVAASTGDKKTLQDEIAKLNGQIVAERDKWKADHENLVKTHQGEKKDMIVRGRLASYNYSKQFDREVAQEAANLGFNKRLAQDGGQMILENGNLKLVNAADPALKFMINNQEVVLNDYMDKFMAESKLIQVNDPAPAQPTGTHYQAPPAPGYTPSPAAINLVKQAQIDAGLVVPS